MFNQITDSILAVAGAEHKGKYVLRIQFSDGMTRDVDFCPFLTRSANPLIRKYLDQNLFQDFTAQDGDLFWHDYDLCFPVADLYENTI